MLYLSGFRVRSHTRNGVYRSVYMYNMCAAYLKEREREGDLSLYAYKLILDRYQYKSLKDKETPDRNYRGGWPWNRLAASV